jgi:hypothetical protein
MRAWNPSELVAELKREAVRSAAESEPTTRQPRGQHQRGSPEVYAVVISSHRESSRVQQT